MELVYSKYYFNLTKIFLLWLFKMGANQIECYTLKQKSIFKFLIAEKYKPCEIYRRVDDVCREACFSQKTLYKWAKHRFVTTSLSYKKIIGVITTYWLSAKENVSSVVVNKEGHIDYILGHKRTEQNWFPRKRCNCKQCFLLPNFFEKSPYLFNNLHYIYIYIYIYILYIHTYVNSHH